MNKVAREIERQISVAYHRGASAGEIRALQAKRAEALDQTKLAAQYRKGAA